MENRALRLASAFVAVFGLAFRHGLRNWRLLVAPLLGLVVAAALAAAVPLYAHGALNRLLEVRVDNLIAVPPDVVWVKAMDHFPKPNQLERYRKLDALVVDHSAGIIGLPQRLLVRYVASGDNPIWPFAPDGTPERDYGRRVVSLVFQSDFAEHVQIVEGEGLPVGPLPEGADVPVVVSRGAASALDLELGERLAYTTTQDHDPPVVPLRVVGFWVPRDPADRYWLYNTATYDARLVTTEESLTRVAAARIPNLLREFSWYGVYDQSSLNGANAERVLTGLGYLEGQSRQHLSSTRVETTLRQSLPVYVRESYVLSTVMLVLSVPTIVVVLLFVGIAMGMVVERQRGEIALLRSRGASTPQVIAVYLGEAILLGGVALAIGPLLGAGIAQLVGQSIGFLQFARRSPVALTLDPQAVEVAGLVVLLALPATVLPAVVAARRSIVSYKQEAARSRGRLDPFLASATLMLLSIAGYGYYTLQQSGSILPLRKGETLVIDPLLVLVPTIFILGVSLLLLQLLPLFTAALARIVAALPGTPVALSLAIRQVARTPRQHAALVLLLMLTLAMGAYSASTAQTIERNLADRVLYAVPADLELAEGWVQDEKTGAFEEPPFEYHYVDGVVGAVPFLSLEATPQLGNRGVAPGRLLAIDRLEYPRAGFWREDFAEKPLGALLNALGADERATLVSRKFLEQSGLRLGDRYTLLFESTPVEFYVAEAVDYFPTLYPEKGPFFVANLSYVLDQIGTQPYGVWVKLEPGTRSTDVVDRMRERGVGAIFMQDSRVTIHQSRSDPQRTGLFGVLSVGFGVAALLTVLGFFLYSSLSFERRLVQMGILRAVGLSTGQLFVGLFLEQLFLVLLGVGLGTGLGLAANALFVPFLQIGAEGQTPRFVVEAPWADLQRVYAGLGLMLLIGLVATAGLVRRLKLNVAVRLGEEQ